MATYIYDYHEERGEFHAHVEDEAGNVVWEVKYPEYLEDDESGELIEASTIFEDGYLKNADDLEGLYYYLRDWGAIEEDDVVVKKEDYEKQQPKDDLLEFTIPRIMANAIVDDEDYFLTENESEQLYNFLQNLTERYGNANLMLGDEIDELGFCTRNDVNNLGGDCIHMYLKPSKKYELGGEINSWEDYDLNLKKFDVVNVNGQNWVLRNIDTSDYGNRLTFVGIDVANRGKSKFLLTDFSGGVLRVEDLEDGGNLPQSEYGYGTSLLAKGGSIEEKIKKKLRDNFELPIEMAVYVPSTEKANQIISKRDYAQRIDEVRSYLASLFGGYSSESIDGGYVSDEKGLIQEDVTKVTAFATKENFEQKLDSLVTQIKKWCGQWGQESIGFEFEGDLFYIDKGGKFMEGGSLPEGYHMMPDGTIMPDSAHMNDGGKVDDKEDEDEEDEDKDEEHLEYISEQTNIPIDVLKEYASNKGIEISELDTDLGFRGSYEDEEKFAEQAVEEGINNLSYYLEMYDTDKRIIVDELTDSYMDGLDDDDILSQSSYEDDAEQLKEAEANLSIYEEQLEEVESEKQDFLDSQDVENMTESDREDVDNALAEFDKRIEELESDISEARRDIRNYGDYDSILDNARDEVREKYYDDLMGRLNKDAVGYFVDELGYDEKDLVNNNGFYVDYTAVAKDLESDYDFIYYDGEVYVFSSYYAWGGGIDLGKSFDKFKQTLNIGTQEVQSQLSDNDFINMAMESVGDAWEDLTSNEQLGIIKGFKEGYGKGQIMARGGMIDPSYTHFAVRKSDGKIVTGWEYNDVDKQSIKYYTTMDLNNMDFKPSEFRILTAKFLKSRGIDPFDVKNWWNHSYDLGGSVEEGNLNMLKNQAREFEHHAEELQEVVEKNPRVDAWVVAKAERASSDLSDITHYLEGQVEMDDEPSTFDKGGTIPKVFEKVTITIRDVDMGGDVIYKNDHWINKKALDEKSSNEIGQYIMRKYGIDYGNTYKFSLRRSGETREKMALGGNIKRIIPNIDTSKKTLDEVAPKKREEVASKIDDLVEMVNEAKQRGEKPKYFNLCNISVPGTNIYCDDNLGIDRNDMPQFKGTARPNSLADQLPKDPKSNEVDTEEFFKLMLNKRGIEVNGGDNDGGIEVEPDILKATQMNMVGDKVVGMYGALEKDPTNRALTAPIYVSNDGYVLDGHHRWAAIVTYNAKNPNNPIPMKVRIIDLPIKPLVRLANEFADSIGIEKKAAVAGQMAKGGETKSEDSQKKSVGGFIAGAIAGSLGTYLYQKNKNKSSTSQRNKSDWREDLKSDIDKEGFDYAMTQLVDEDEINDEFKKLRNNYLSALKKVKNLYGLKKEDKDELESYYDSDGIDYTLVEKGVWRGIKNTKFQANRKEYIKSRDAIKKYLGLDKNYAKGGVLSDVDMYVKIHGYYPEEVMALRGDGMGLGIVKNEAHKFELSSEDSRRAEEMGYEFDYYDAKGWVEKEEDDYFAKGGGIKNEIPKRKIFEYVKNSLEYNNLSRAERTNIKKDKFFSKADGKEYYRLTINGDVYFYDTIAKRDDQFNMVVKLTQGNYNDAKNWLEKNNFAKGGATFDDKVKAISKNLKGRKVPKKLQKDYGKTYDTKEERDDAARRIAGAMRAEEMGTRKK